MTYNKLGAQLLNLTTPLLSVLSTHASSTLTHGLHYPGFFSLTHVFVSVVVIPLVCCPHFVGSVTFYIPLLHSRISRGRACIFILFSLLIVDCFGHSATIVPWLFLTFGNDSVRFKSVKLKLLKPKLFKKFETQTESNHKTVLNWTITKNSSSNQMVLETFKPWTRWNCSLVRFGFGLVRSKFNLSHFKFKKWSIFQNLICWPFKRFDCGFKPFKPKPIKGSNRTSKPERFTKTWYGTV